MPGSQSGDRPAGLLLTGGRSRRLGRDKALLPIAPGGAGLARHVGEMLASVTSAALEVGPGFSGLKAVLEADRFAGPLVAVVAGSRQLPDARRPVLVVATDLPRLSFELLERLATWPASPSRSVIPMVSGRLQPLCARWSPAAVERAAELVASGERRAQAAFSSDEVVVLASSDLSPFGVDLELELSDVDDEEDLRRLGLEDGPPGG